MCVQIIQSVYVQGIHKQVRLTWDIYNSTVLYLVTRFHRSAKYSLTITAVNKTEFRGKTTRITYAWTNLSKCRHRHNWAAVIMLKIPLSLNQRTWSRHLAGLTSASWVTQETILRELTAQRICHIRGYRQSAGPDCHNVTVYRGIVAPIGGCMTHSSGNNKLTSTQDGDQHNSVF